MWAKWASFYNRAKSANADLSLFERAWRLCAMVFGSTVLAWASRTWGWYWDTFSWAGVGFAFLVSWVVIALGIFLSGIGVYLWRNYRLWNSIVPRSGQSTEITASTQILRNASSLKDVHFYSGSISPSFNSRFVAKFVRNGQRARFYVEDRYYVTGLGTPSRVYAPQVLVDEIKDFVANQPIDIAILTPFENDARKLWRWGPPTEIPDPKTTFQSGAWHCSRVVVLVDDILPEHFYFIIDLAAADVPPNVIGQERFEFVQKWESENEHIH